MVLIDKTKTTKPKTHVYMILDSSGSMGSIWDQAINHFNEQVDDLKKRSKEHDIDVSLITFNSDVTIARRLHQVSTVRKISREDYSPSGGTALFDAIGYAIDDLQKHAKDLQDENTGVLFLIVTDGEENSSKEYSRANLRSRMDLLKTQGWTFTFLAANVDPMEIHQTFGVSVNNIQVYDATEKGMTDGTYASTVASSGYFGSRSAGLRSVDNFYTNDVVSDSVQPVDGTAD